MKGTPAMPGGSLASKPTWRTLPKCSTTSVFFSHVGQQGATMVVVGDDSGLSPVV